MLFKSKKIIGLDIGTSSIKVAEMDVSRGSATLQKFAMVETPKAGMAIGDIVDVNPLSEAVRFVCDQAKIKFKKTSTGLWGSSVIVKKISIPKVEKSFVAEQIRWEAEQYIPYEVADVNLDFQILNSTSGGSDSMDILLVAAKKDQIMKYIEIVESAGQELSIIDVSGFALGNIFEFNYPKNKETVGLLDIGAHYTNFVVLQGQDIIFCRDISAGGALYSAEIQKAMRINFEEAESLKLSAVYNNSIPEDLSSVIQGANEVYCDDLSATVEFFYNTTPDIQISRLYVTGGASRTPGIIQAISDVTKIETVMLDPLQRVKVNKSLSAEFKTQYRDFISMALGLGLRKLGD